MPAHVPIAREAIRRNRAALLGLAAELRQPAEVCPQGVAITRLLVTEGAGPLYDHDAADAALEQTVSRAGRRGRITAERWNVASRRAAPSAPRP